MANNCFCGFESRKSSEASRFITQFKKCETMDETGENDISVEQLKGEPLISVIEWKVNKAAHVKRVINFQSFEVRFSPMNRNKGTIRFKCYQVAVYYVAENVKSQN